MIGFGFLCLTIVAIVYIYKEFSCNHKWVDTETEYTSCVYGGRYKVITQKCEKCGKVKVTKYLIN